VPLRIFIHGTNIVIDRGLKVLFSAFICYFSVFFSLPPLPLRKFSADAFDHTVFEFSPKFELLIKLKGRES